MDQLRGRANYFRVCQLLIEKGGDALRHVLQTKINICPPPSTLDSLLNAHKKILQRIRYSVITATQWKLLFPLSGSPDSNNFDITLLTILLRNICGLPSPAAGWNVMPPVSDTSISAEILRIKMFRNEVYCHVSSGQLDDTEFEALWREISRSLIKLGIPQQDIDELKLTALSPEEESNIKKLKEWQEHEDNHSSKLHALQQELAKLRNKIVGENVKTSEIFKLAKFVFRGKIKELSKRFQSGTRKWFFDEFKEWLDDEKSSVMILTAGPGVGKSVLSARICELYEESGQLAACHFCDFRTSDCRDPYRILQSLASQMCENVDGFRDKLAEALSREHSRDSLSDAFRVLLNDPLHALERAEPMLIVVDALDEVIAPFKRELLDLISDQFSQLPKWIKIFISSRPEFQVREKFEHLNPVEIRPDDYKNNLDLLQFIQCYLPSISENDIESLVSKCEGSFLYAYYLVKEQVDSGTRPDVNVDIPKDISRLYEEQLKLKKTVQYYEQILREHNLSVESPRVGVSLGDKESPGFWKWKVRSITHREKLMKLREHAKIKPTDFKEVNGVRVCCSEEFLIGMGILGTRVYVGVGKDGVERAVKRLPKDACSSLAEQEAQVLNELKAVKSNHVVNYWFLDESDEEHIFLILDLCEETLEDFIKHSPETDLDRDAPEIIKQIMKGLADIHSEPKPILHRDLKPSNILRDVEGNWLLADFGISRILKEDVKTLLSASRGTEHWKAVESCPSKTSKSENVRYKKESDIQVAGMVSFYILTKGEHPFGEIPDRLRNLLDGKPVGLNALKDPAAKDLITWMLSHDPNDRPPAKEALKHPYLQPAKEQFEMLCKVGNQPEIKTQDIKSDVVRKLNSDSQNWKNAMEPKILKFLAKGKVSSYKPSKTDCLRFIRNVTQHWDEHPRPRPQEFYTVGNPQEYFLKLFKGLPLEVYRIVKSCDWKERPDLQEYFI